METLFSLLIVVIVVVVLVWLIVWLLGQVTIIPPQVRQIIIAAVALILAVYFIGVLMGVLPLPHFR